MTAPIEVLRQNARWLKIVRQHFDETGAFEVVTPALSSSGVTDPHIESLAVPIPGLDTHYLHTSPEYAMKRLLVKGSGDIYQICRVYRADESGRFHSPEFTMLEWYRVGQDHRRLILEVDFLLRKLWTASGSATAGISLPPTEQISYIDTMEKICATPFSLITASIISQCLTTSGIEAPTSMDSTIDDQLDEWLDLMLSLLVIPRFKKDRFTCLVDYPASQSALARICQNNKGIDVAERFEFFFGEVELANGYHELQDANQHRTRFEKNLNQRRARGLTSAPIDNNFLDAIGDGLPDCAGVALGLERLFMILAGKNQINEIMAFGIEDA